MVKSYSRATTMSLESSKRSLAKATIRDLEDYKKWLSKSTFLSSGAPATEYTAGMDAETAKMPFFSKENAGNWVVAEKWHTYQMEIRRQLSRSGGASASSTSRSTTKR